MFCPKCGGEVGSQPFCKFCGANVNAPTAESPPAPKPKRQRFARGLSWCFGIFLILWLLHIVLPVPEQPVAVTSVTNQITQQNAPAAPTDSSQQPAESPSPPENQPQWYETGQSFSVGYWSYLCHNAYWTPVLGFGPYSTERANADFVVVDITVRNDDTSASTLPPFKLVDAQIGSSGERRTYDESSAGMLSQGFFSVLEQLNPGVSKRGNIAFDVPPDRTYVLVVSGGIESGKRAMVTLPMSWPRKDSQPPSTTTSP